MKKYFLIVCAFVCCTVTSVNASDISFSQDTYADALHNSHNADFDATGGGYLSKEIGYLAPTSLPSVPVYGALPDVAGGGYDYNLPKDNIYLPPAPSSTVFGPTHSYNYPQEPFHKPVHPIPYYSHDSFFAKLKSKMSVFTLGKIILKLLIFKKIVKFIGIICLLLVLPKLKSLFSDNMSVEDGGMNSKHVETDKEKLEKQITEIYEFITNFIQDFEEKY